MKTALELKNELSAHIIDNIRLQEDANNMTLEEREYYSLEVLDRLICNLSNLKQAINDQKSKRFWDKKINATY